MGKSFAESGRRAVVQFDEITAQRRKLVFDPVAHDDVRVR
jgi:hypothetical protein